MDAFLYFVGGVVLGGLVSWGITHAYYKRASREQADELQRLTLELSPKTRLIDFEDMLNESEWIADTIDGREVWIAKNNNTFQIERGDREREFAEPWTERHPDKYSSLYPVFL